MILIRIAAMTALHVVQSQFRIRIEKKKEAVHAVKTSYDEAVKKKSEEKKKRKNTLYKQQN